jgi:hypothetical protein
MTKFRVVSAADWLRKHEARIEAMTMDEAVARVLNAVSALMDQEGDRIGAHPFDWTYHGCDPGWKEVGKACSDLAEKQLGIKTWRVPSIQEVGAAPSATTGGRT